MTRQLQLRSALAALGLAAIVAASSGPCAYARGGRGGGFARGGFDRGGFARGGFDRGGFDRGGFAREGPAAAGSFASRSDMFGHGFQANQANRMAYGEHAQASRQQEANTLQSNREQTAQNLQSNAQQYHGYPYGAYRAWDAGAGWAAAATGAAIGAAATAAATAPYGAAYTASEPCANPASVSVGDMTYFRCGSNWYRQAYGPSGPGYVAVAPPPGL